MDEAAQWLSRCADLAPLTPEEEKKTLRKMDWILLPMLFMTANLGAVDKVALSNAAIYGLKEDLNLKGQQYSWAGSILAIGAVAGMWPSMYLVHRLPSAKYLACCSLCWSAMALITPATHNWGGLMALRFLMGALEAIIVPSISIIIAGFYKKSEQPPRNALVFASASSIHNGFLSWALSHIPASAPLSSISFAWSLFVLWYLPDTPMNAKFLDERQKYHIVQRLAENQTGIANRKWKWYQAREALYDPRTWILFCFNISINIPNGGLQTFSSIIINNLGFTEQQTSLLNMPTDVAFTLTTFFWSWVAGKWHNRRCLASMLACIIPIAGAIMVYTIPREDIGPQMLGIYMLYTYFGPYVVGISLAQANTAGSTKKSVQYALLYIGYAVGNLIGPQTFQESQAPAYTGGFVAMLACYCICAGLMGLYWAISFAQNRRRVAAAAEQRNGDCDLVGSFADRTDFEQKTFIYTT
ncbi:uncharacterized protein NECHADRAFT_46191 [Fusarium vanettenii 77-13-4]|uniref:Major facilitator superfamily (MFS) profile domain-containing protein n=1 Tax=Fusarium vanettenii (strain ATCC MYA-4622 / CBS 123669 / FGSC 9596 / NRRL 45880 / 77-13-4) TaxID=660122 RepID=C7Z4D1_FUSV7|nr:uncharacterized protein NECHADRAFT_46191 [Fusarium vanettenii 77-13-4]EEU41298.1 hypothetical protein NECHADRAFT_46191 [Fusarium vanettenii 77-13-4]